MRLKTTHKHPYIQGGAIIEANQSDADMLISRGYAVADELDAMIQEAMNAPAVSKTYKIKPTKPKKK